MNEVLPAEKALSLLEPIRRSVYYVCLTKQTVYMSVHGRYACVAMRDVAQQIVHKPEQSRIIFFFLSVYEEKGQKSNSTKQNKTGTIMHCQRQTWKERGKEKQRDL